MDTVELNNGVTMPIVGYGVYQIPDARDCTRCVIDASTPDIASSIQPLAIGVSNFKPDRLMDIAAFNEVKLAVNQVEINPFQQQEDSVAFMRQLAVRAEGA